MANYPDRFEDSIARMKRLALRYTGFKFYLLILLCSFIAGLLLTAYCVGALPRLPILFTFNWIKYIWFFWMSHPWLFSIFVTTYLAVLLANILEGPFAKRVLPIPPLSDEDDRTKRLFRRLNRYMTIAFFFAFLLAVPVIHLWLPVWYGAAGFVVGLGSTIISAWFSLAQPSAKGRIERLGHYQFRGAPSFNTASMGAESIEVKRELSYYETIREVSPISVRVSDYLRIGSDSYRWHGLARFYEKLATFLEVPATWITTHQNTTKAIRHALELCINDDTYIVTTDLEYGSVLDAISKVARKDRLSVLQFRGPHIAKRMDYRVIIDAVAEELNTLFSSASETRYVVVLSHVAYLTGAVLDIQRFEQKVKVDKSRLVLIIDGAQAVGNIQLPLQLHKLLRGSSGKGVKDRGAARL